MRLFKGEEMNSVSRRRLRVKSLCHYHTQISLCSDPKPEDPANPNIYGNQLDKEALISAEASDSGEYLEDKPCQENFDYPYPEYSESDRDR